MLGFKRKCKVYDSIHNLPYLLYYNIGKSGDYSLLVYEGDYKGNLEDVWAKIYDEDEEAFGGNSTYKDYLGLKLEEADLLEDCYVNGNRVSWTFAAVKEAEAQQLINDSSGNSISDVLKNTSKSLGFPIDLRTMSVFTFKSYVYGKI